MTIMGLLLRATNLKFPLLFIAAFMVCRTARAAEPPPDVEAVVERCLKSYEAVNDYTCVFSRREKIREKIVEDKGVRARFKKPMRIFLQWTGGPRRGTESIYWPEKYGDKVKAHQGGLLKFATVTLNPDGALAMRDSRHSIREFGLGHLADQIAADIQKALAAGEGRIIYQGESVVAGEPVWVFEGVFPVGHGYYSQRSVISFAQSNALPLKAVIYGPGDEFLEEYTFEELRLNPALSDKDFEFERP